MYTLIEIFDAKQYENIVSPVSLNNISKLIYVGSEKVMTKEKANNLSNFFKLRNFDNPIEYFYVKRDNSQSVFNAFESIISENENCIIDITGGEDVLLASAGIFAGLHNIPIIRTDAKDGKHTVIYGSFDGAQLASPLLKVNDLTALQGCRIVSSESDSVPFTKYQDDIFSLFRINSYDCEAYGVFCNFVSEFISYNMKILSIPTNEIEKRNEFIQTSVKKIISRLLTAGLITKSNSSGNVYTIKNSFIAKCLKKTGNILEYYTAYAAQSISECFSDVHVGTTVEWRESSSFYETQNEIDVLAVSHNVPVFISCKNGDVKKEALYELDTVSRIIGGSYAKKILVCTDISSNRSAREHIIKRAHDMNIKIIYDAHIKTYEEFQSRLKNAVI